MRKLQNVEVDGHKLSLKLSQRNTTEQKAETNKRKTSDASSAKLPPSSKILVKNLAFEAAPKDLRQLFSTFGQIKSVRMPKKFDGSHRGFAFVDFITKNEAANAFQALTNTHMYGRHLVLDWAKEVCGVAFEISGAAECFFSLFSPSQDDTIEDIRSKAVEQMVTESMGGFNPNAASKKRKVVANLDSSSKSFAGAFGSAEL